MSLCCFTLVTFCKFIVKQGRLKMNTIHWLYGSVYSFFTDQENETKFHIGPADSTRHLGAYSNQDISYFTHDNGCRPNGHVDSPGQPHICNVVITFVLLHINPTQRDTCSDQYPKQFARPPGKVVDIMLCVCL